MGCLTFLSRIHVLQQAIVIIFFQAVKEKETLRRSYFLFVAAVVTNDVTVVLTSQSESLILTIIFHFLSPTHDAFANADPSITQDACYI